MNIESLLEGHRVSIYPLRHQRRTPPPAGESCLLHDDRIANHPKGMTSGIWIMSALTVAPYIGCWKGLRGVEAVTLTRSS